jgi:hypothetical protein
MVLALGIAGLASPAPMMPPPAVDPNFEFFAMPFTSFQRVDPILPFFDISFRLACDQSFIELIRHDVESSSSSNTVVVVGALIHQIEAVDCRGTGDKTVRIDASSVYRAKNYQIVPLLK